MSSSVSTVKPGSASAPRILVVEDDQLMAMHLCQTVGTLGCEVAAVARAGAAALRLADELRPDLALIDVTLEDGGDGIEAALKIHEQNRIPVVYLTSQSDDEFVLKTVRSGAFAHLMKPVRPSELKAAVAIALKQHRMWNDLREENAWLANLLENIAEGVISIDRDGLVDFLNPRGEEITGWTLAEARGMPVEAVYSLLPPDSQAAEPRIRAAARLEAPLQAERFLLRTRRGSDLPVEETVSPRRRDGQVTGAIAVFRDLSETVQHEQAQKYETIGVLAGGVAHDFNNLLAVMVGNASLAMELVADPRVRECLNEVIASGSRAAELTSQLLAYAGKTTVRKTAVDLAEEVRQIAAHLKAAVPERIDLSVDLGGELNIEADPKQLRQIVMNLAVNACEAIGDSRGSIDISAGFVDPAADHVFLRVRDTGPGMDAATRSRIFDPFFTTKFTGRGLGLAAVQGIVRSHGGTIDVDTRPGHGSTFTVVFPAGAVRAISASAPPDLASLRGTETVLVVDDIESVWRFTRTALERLGYRVFVANDGKSALEILASRIRLVDLVLLDLSMPGMSGAEVGRRIREAFPGISICLMSGYNEEVANQQFKGLTFSSEFIQKPFTQHQLAVKLRLILDHARRIQPAHEEAAGDLRAG